MAIRHKPIIDLVDPAIADTVDSGVRTGIKANPYDLDFSVRAFDLQGSTEVQLFFAEISGLTSLSATGSFPNQKFVLGKSVSGNRGTAIPESDTLTSVDTEFTWDITDSVFANSDSVIVAEGTYYIYLVASDSINVALRQSTALLTVKHSPSFTFYEPPRDSHREINTGSQPVYAIQWQKGRGDADFDDNATIDLYFTTDNPATINYENFPDSLLNDVDTKTIVKGLTENGEAASDMYVWDLRNPPNDVPKESVSGGKVWLYAIITDSRGNKNVALGGALTMIHDPHITILSSKLDDYVPRLREGRRAANRVGRLPGGRWKQHRRCLHQALRDSDRGRAHHPRCARGGGQRNHRLSHQQLKRQSDWGHGDFDPGGQFRLLRLEHSTLWPRHRGLRCLRRHRKGLDLYHQHRDNHKPKQHSVDTGRRTWGPNKLFQHQPDQRYRGHR